MPHVDTAVVGGGIIGCLIARELAAAAPDRTVTVIDKDDAGTGASRRSAGLHFPRGASERVREMSAYSQDYYARLKTAEPGVPIHPSSMVVVAAQTNAETVREVYLDSASLRRIPDAGPRVRLAADSAVWAADGCQYADVSALTRHLASALRRHLTFREGVEVTGLDVGEDHVTLTLSSQETLTADSVVLAVGPWLSVPAWEQWLTPLGLRVKKIVALHVDEPPDADDGVIVFHDEDAFLLPRHDHGYWLFSYTCQEWDVEPEDLRHGISVKERQDALAVLSRWRPEAAARAVGGRVFCDAYSPNREPVVRALDDAGRVVFAGAANGSGYRLAPAIAAQAVRAVLGGRGSRRPFVSHS